MSRIIGTVLAAVLLAVVSTHAAAEDADTQNEMRSLDEQVQEIKSDVLAIAKDLSLLEEKLLYPSSTQLAVFVSLAPEETFRLDAVQVTIDGEVAAHYIYSFKELEALQNGGVQRIYSGNVPTGSHELTVSVSGKLDGGEEIAGSRSFGFSKGVEPKLLGLTLSAGAGGPTIELGDW